MSILVPQIHEAIGLSASVESSDVPKAITALGGLYKGEVRIDFLIFDSCKI